MKLDDFGKVSVMTGGIEMGQGFNAALTLTSAEALGVTPDRITIAQVDTATCPWDVGTHASRGAFTSGNAAIMAAQKAREKIFQLAAEHFMPRVHFNLKRRQKKDRNGSRFQLIDVRNKHHSDKDGHDRRDIEG